MPTKVKQVTSNTTSRPSLTIKDIPISERPRERILQHGATHCTNQDLIALILRSGTKTDSVLHLSQRILQQFEGLQYLQHATLEELTSINGIGETKAIQLLATCELGKRIATFRVQDRVVIRSPQDGANYVMQEMKALHQEHFVCAYLNTKNQVIHKQTVFIGSLNASIVHPREVYREALRRSSASLICFHNHPSGVRLQGA